MAEHAEHQQPRGELTRAARLLEVRTPAEELQRLVQARMETLAKLAGDGRRRAVPRDAERLDTYAEALELGLRRLREVRR